MVKIDTNNLILKDIKVNNNVPLGKFYPKMSLLTPEQVLEKYPTLRVDWNENDLLNFHAKGLFLAKTNEDGTSILIVEQSIIDLIKIRDKVLTAKTDILKRNIEKGSQIQETQ